jgi:pimeloyl-ACP methyl ester carboxylesterase
MALLHHDRTGSGQTPLVFVHGFACDHTDWCLQVSHFAPHHQTIAVDLPGHGRSPGEASDCNLESFGRAVGDLMRELALPPSVIFGHSMGCRVALEAARSRPGQTAGIVLVDGSQFDPAMKPVVETGLANGEFPAIANDMFEQMFTAKSDPEVSAAIISRALTLPEAIGKALLLELIRYDTYQLETTLAETTVPVLALQSTATNAQRHRATMSRGETSPYLDMLRRIVPHVTVDIVPDTGHFPQLDAAEDTNASIAKFLAKLSG